MRRRLILLGLVAVLFFVADAWAQTATSVWLEGPLDETAHLLTALLVIWAAGGLLDRIAVPLLVASVAIDLDHLPGDFGARWLTAGDPRPYPHALLTVVLTLLLAWRVRRWRTLLLGAAVGLIVHFWRDLAEPGTGVGLLWPVSTTSFSLPHSSYLAVMVGLLGLSAWRAWHGLLWLGGCSGNARDPTGIGRVQTGRRSDREPMVSLPGRDD